jgi:alkylation response protein AidB-like acyl-CoA dehydrogenase
MTDFGVERIYRAVRASKIYEGTNDIQRLVISRALVDQTAQDERTALCS